MKNFGPGPIVSTVIRTILYCLLVAGTTFLLIKTAGSPSQPATFTESSVIERLQLVYLCACMILFILSAKTTYPRISLSVLLAGVTLIATVRELDYFFDKYVFDGAWQSIVFLVVLLTGALVFKFRQSLKPSIQEFISKTSFGYMTAAFITLFVFSRMIGMQLLWRGIMGESYMRTVKTFVEESTELFGYTLLLIAAIEFYRETRRAS